jgi:hypothetical protein
MLNQLQKGRDRKDKIHRHNSLEKAIRGAKNLERLEKNRVKQDREKLKEMTANVNDKADVDSDDSSKKRV